MTVTEKEKKREIWYEYSLLFPLVEIIHQIKLAKLDKCRISDSRNFQNSDSIFLGKNSLTGCSYVVKGLQNPYEKLPNDVCLGNKSTKKLLTAIYLCKCDSIMFSPRYLQNLFNNFSTTINKLASVHEGTTLVPHLLSPSTCFSTFITATSIIQFKSTSVQSGKE